MLGSLFFFADGELCVELGVGWDVVMTSYLLIGEESVMQRLVGIPIVFRLSRYI